MNIPIIKSVLSISVNHAMLSWFQVVNATKYYVDVATDEAFTNNIYVDALVNKSLYDGGVLFHASGLVQNTLYYYRVKASNADDTDISADSMIHSFKTSAVIKGLVFEFDRPDDVDIESFAKILGLNIEIAFGTPLSIKLISKDLSPIHLANCKIENDGWVYKGEWTPGADPNPGTQSEGDYYTITQDGSSDITGSTEDFSTSDLLVYESGQWNLVTNRAKVSDADGVASFNFNADIQSTLIIEKSGYETERLRFSLAPGFHTYTVTLYKQKSVIHTKTGHAINLNPRSRENIIFE